MRQSKIPDQGTDLPRTEAMSSKNRKSHDSCELGPEPGEVMSRNCVHLEGAANCTEPSGEGREAAGEVSGSQAWGTLAWSNSRSRRHPASLLQGCGILSTGVLH